MSAELPRFLLGPMAGITDAAMRSVCIAHGAPLCYTEMISARGLVCGNRNTGRLLRRLANEKRYIVQIFGREPAVMAAAAGQLEAELGDALAGLDINMGCPAPKVFRHGEGAALMGEPELAAKIIRACADAVAVPLSVKFRAGLNAREINAADFARMAEGSGADRITVHGRTAAQMYRGQSDPGIIAAVKAAVAVPVIANGDVCSAASAAALLSETGCDSVMVARGAIGNPFLFAELSAYFDSRPLPDPPTPRDRIGVLLRQTELAAADKGEQVAVREMRAQIPRYLRGLHGAAAVRGALNQAGSLQELGALLQAYLERLEAHGATTGAETEA